MVRLKEGDEIRIYADYYISIPYGAIKRKEVKDDIYFTRPFQFLMVRLKVENNNPVACIGRFQFLMVRLKVFLYSSQFHLLPNFNSLWCD